MDVDMDSMEGHSSNAGNDSEEQQTQSEGGSSGRPSLSQMKKSWGFRRSTIARREFLDEVGDLSHSPPAARRTRARKTNKTPDAPTETPTTQGACRSTKSVLEDLEWSAPPSPVSEDSKPASETCAPGSFDPSLWQDIGSAFDTAFSLLGGGEDFTMDFSETMADPQILEDAVEPPLPLETGDTETASEEDVSYGMEISQPAAPEDVPGGDMDDVVLISSQGEDSDDMTLIQIKEKMTAQGRNGNTRGRGRGRGVELLPSIVDHEDDEVVLVGHPEHQLQEEDKTNEPHIPSETGISPAHSVVSLSPAQRSGSDCILIDTFITDVMPGQFDDALQERRIDDMNVEAFSGATVPDGLDSDVLCNICQQKQDKRFMICCGGCQNWFHGDCARNSNIQGYEMEKDKEELICFHCTAQRQSQLQPESHFQLEHQLLHEPQTLPEPQLQHEPQLLPELQTLPEAQLLPEPLLHPLPEIIFPEFLRAPDEHEKGREEPQVLTEAVVVQEEKVEAALPVKSEPGPEVEMETGGSHPLCIGPGCSRPALQDSVYCGPNCILGHAAFAMKTLSDPKVPKSKGRGRGRAAAARPTAKGQRPGRMSKRLSGKTEEVEEEEEVKEDEGGQKEAVPPSPCNPSEVQTSSIPSSKFYTASETENNQEETDREAKTLPTQSPGDNDAATASEPAAEQAPPQSRAQVKAKEEPKVEPTVSGVSKKKSVDPVSSKPTNPAKLRPSTAAQPPSTSSQRQHKTGAVIVSNTSYVIPKKQSGPQPQSSQVLASVTGQKTSSAPSLLSETRNLPVPPAPSAPSARPSQPNNQVRQSIQRTLISILSKRVCDCEDLEMSESEVGKLVGSIETEMFDLFRNTDSKYMNKYRTIMFNLKDPKNKGLLYNLVRGEISPFRLVRMSQKDMQAVKAPEPISKATTEVKDAAAKASSLPQRPEAVKVDLPSLNPPRPIKSMEQKKSLPAPILKTRPSQQSQGAPVRDVLACMLKDTTSEHKAHLFDLKCKICTGQLVAGEDGEPAKKKPKVSDTKDQYETPRRVPAGDDSPLMAPLDSPDLDSPTSPCLVIDDRPLTIVESPASPVMESPASPTLESPASPIMDSPASPTPETSTATVPKKAYTPVVIPAVSTVTITRRDPRTAASRFNALSGGNSGLSNPTQNQSAPYAPFKDIRSTVPPAPAPLVPPKKPLPKSILMKPSSSSDPRLYGTTSRTQKSESPPDNETAQFLSKGEIVWKGFLNMLTIAKFVTKAYLVSGPAENLKADLPDTIQIGGRIMPATVWDYVAKLKTSISKELCVIRFHPATEEEEVAYVSLFSYFSSRGRFGVVANISRSIKDVYLVPLSAKESIPSILQPFEGPGLEKNRPNLLLGLAIIQRTKRPGSLPSEIEEKRPKVHMPKDPMWIPKPPVLYGSDKLEMFQPYDPETPASPPPPASPPCPGSPSGSSSSGSVTIPSLLSSIQAKPPVSTSSTAAAPQSSNVLSGKDPSTPSDATPLQTILKTLFRKTDSIDSSEVCSSTSTAAKTAGVKKGLLSKVSGSIVDPIVQQYGQKSKVREIEEEEDDFDRPYDPEEEYEPAMGYGVVDAEIIDKNKGDTPATPDFVDDDIAYDPEDETIFDDFHSNTVTNQSVPTPPVSAQTSECSSLPTSTPPEVPASASTPAQQAIPSTVTELPLTGTVVVSAATLTEQQRMLEELNKQIEEQKRQLKEQEEALRQQREAVGMFMAHFSVTDTLMSPPSKTPPLSQLPSLQSNKVLPQSKPSAPTNNLTETANSTNKGSQSVSQDDSSVVSKVENDSDSLQEQTETQEKLKENDKCSVGEIDDSSVAYDPEDESLFNEIQDDVFQIGTSDSSKLSTGHSSSHKSSPGKSHHSRKQRLSPKRSSHRERDRHRSPSRRSQRRSASRSRRHRERDRHRKSERERSRHRDQSERQSRHRRERTMSRHSHGRRRSPSSPRKKDSVSSSSKLHRERSPQVLERSKHLDVKCPDPESSDPVAEQLTIKKESDEHHLAYSVESHDKEHKVLPNMKLEIAEPLKQFAIDDDEEGSSSSKVDKPPIHETLLNKIDSTIPLREIDPPLRDSPESPDPDPQFVQPVSEEQSEFASSEDKRDPLADNSVLLLPVKAENKWLSDSGQETLPNVTGSTPSGNVMGLDGKAQDIQYKGLSDHGIKEKVKLVKRESLGLDHTGQPGQVDGHSDQAKYPDIQSLEPVIHPITKWQGPDVSNQVSRSPRPELVDLRLSRPQINVSKAEERFKGPDTKGTDRPIVCSVPNTTNLAVGCSGISLSNPRTGMHDLVQNTRKADLQLYKMDLPLQNQENSNIQGVSTLVKGKDTELMRSKHEMRRHVTDQAVTNSDKSKQNQQADPEKRGASPFSRFLGKESGSPQGQWQRKGNEKISPEIGGPMPNIERRRGPGPYFRDQTHQIRGQDQSDLEIERRNKWIGPQIRGSIPVRGEDECRIQSDWRDQYNRASAVNTNFNESMPDINPNIQNLTLDRRGQEGQDFSKLESERSASTSDNVVPCIERTEAQQFSQTGPDSSNHPMEGHGLNSERTGFRGPWSDVRSPENVSFGAGRARDREISGQGPENRPHTRTDRQGSFSEMGHERNDLFMDAQRPFRRGPRGQDLREPGHEKSDPLVERPGTETEEPNDPSFRGTGLQRRGPFTGHGQDPNRPGGPNFRGQLPERRGVPLKDIEPDMRGSGLQRGGPPLEGPGYDRGGQEYPSFRGPGPQRREASMEDPLHDMRGPGNPGFRGPDPQRRGHGHDIGGPEKPGFRESGPEKDCTPECPGNLGAGPGRPDFTETIPERKGPPLEGPWHDKCPGGLNNRGPWPKQRSPYIEGPGFDRSGQRALDLKGKGINMEDHGQDVRGPHNPHFRDIGLQRRGPPLEGPGPGNRRGPEVPNFRGSGPEIRDPSMERPGSDMGGHDGQDFSGPLFERRGPSNEGHWPDGRGPVGPDIRESGPEKRGHFMEGTGDEMRGFQGPDFRRKEPGTRSGSTEVPGHDRARSDHDREGPGTQNLRVPRPERGGPLVEGLGFDTKQPLGPDFRGLGPERRGPSLERPGPDRTGTDFMRPGVEERDKRVEDLWTNRRGPQGPDFRGPRPECRNPAMEGIAPVRKDVGCTGFGAPGPGRQVLRGTGNDISNTVDCQEPNPGGPSGSDVLRMGSSRRGRGGPNLRGPGFERSSSTMQDPGLDRGGQYRIGSGPNMEGPVPSRWDPDVKGPRPRRPGFGMERSGFSNTREPGIEHLGQTSDETGQNRRGPNCQGFPGARQEGRPLDKEGPEPYRRSQHFRGARPRPSVMQGPGPENRERSDFRDLVLESRGQDEGQDWRLGGPDFRDPDTGLRDSNTVNPIHTDGTGQDFEGSEFIQGGPGVQRRGGRTGPHLRGRGLIRRRPRGRRANQSNQEDRWEGQDFEGIDPQQQWSDQREPDMMAPGNEGDFPEEEWNSGPGQTQEIPNEQLQEFTRQGPDTGYRGYARRGRRPMQARPNMPFPGSLSRSGDEWGGPDHSDQDPAQDDPVFQGPERGRPGNRWRESHRGHNRGVPSPFYRGGRHPNSRGRGHERISDMNGPRSDFREGPDFLNSGPECRASNNEAPGLDRRFSGGGETVPGSDQQEFKAPHFNGPHQVPRFQGPFDPHAASNIRPRGTAPNTGQNQEAGRLFRHRSALLPTPGRSRFPNRGRGRPDSSFDM